MKKFLAIVLCAAISCSIYIDLKKAGFLKEEDEELLSRIPDLMKRNPDKYDFSLHYMDEKIQNVWKYLNEIGFMENPIEQLKKLGEDEMQSICEKYVHEDICDNPINSCNKILQELLEIFK